MEINSSSNDIVAPFVMKTYQMVSDPTTNELVLWGRDNNSFIVLKPLDFSWRVLPVYFKHSNFSSFVRQLNTYGFKKVDPDRWEFANVWFLRGQTQLLKKIVRKKQTISRTTYGSEEDEIIAMEIAKLKEEQRSLEEEVESMNRRLETTDKRPQQMMTFLLRLVDHPLILPPMKEMIRLRRLTCDDHSSDKKRKINVTAASSSRSLLFDSSHDGGGGGAVPPINVVTGNECDSGDGVYSTYFESLVAGETTNIPFPFSLLGGGV